MKNMLKRGDKLRFERYKNEQMTIKAVSMAIFLIKKFN